MVHNTKRKTQPWKSGLPVDFIPAERFRLFPPIGWLMRARRQLFGDYGLLGQLPAPSRQPSRRTCSSACCASASSGASSASDLLREEMRRNHVRHDAFEVIERTPPLAA